MKRLVASGVFFVFAMVIIGLIHSIVGNLVSLRVETTSKVLSHSVNATGRGPIYLRKNEIERDEICNMARTNVGNESHTWQHNNTIISARQQIISWNVDTKDGPLLRPRHYPSRIVLFSLGEYVPLEEMKISFKTAPLSSIPSNQHAYLTVKCDNSNTVVEEKKQYSIHDELNPCRYVSDWQSQLHPSCNAVHEIDFVGGMSDSGTRSIQHRHQTQLHILAFGTTRVSWKYQCDGGGPILIKTIQYQKEYTEMMEERQRIDAIATEMLSSHDEIVNVYGFCGDVTLNEYAQLGDLEQYLSNVKGGATKLSPLQRLLFARDAAVAVSHVHEVGRLRKENKFTNRTSLDYQPAGATMVHHDIKMSNFLVVSSAESKFLPDIKEAKLRPSFVNSTAISKHTIGSDASSSLLKLKLHDFNNAHLMKVKKKNPSVKCSFRYSEPCDGIKIGSIEERAKSITNNGDNNIDNEDSGKYVNKRAPEECYAQIERPLDDVFFGEYVEVYRLGVFLFQLLTGGYPFHFESDRTRNQPEVVLNWLTTGRSPSLPSQVEKEAKKYVETEAVVNATRRAMTFHYQQRPKARQIARYLQSVVEQVSSPL